MNTSPYNRFSGYLAIVPELSFEIGELACCLLASFDDFDVEETTGESGGFDCYLTSRGEVLA